jgi:hypothetical protein
MFPRSTRRSSILSRPSGRRSEPLVKNATVVLGTSAAKQRIFTRSACGIKLALRSNRGLRALVNLMQEYYQMGAALPDYCCLTGSQTTGFTP